MRNSWTHNYFLQFDYNFKEKVYALSKPKFKAFKNEHKSHKLTLI